MQVKKFEAKTIKDAIEMVKFHLGPDAIILSAKDNSKRFGLMGESSVEVTAAVSESKLAKKKMAESKLNDRAKIKYQSAPAKVQRDYIEKSYANKMNDLSQEAIREKAAEERAAVPRRQGVTAARYIDIVEESDLNHMPAQPVVQAAPTYAPAVNSRESIATDRQTQSLQNEIQYLRQMLEKFQNMPQNFLTLHPGADVGLPYELSFAYKRLIDAGMSEDNIVNILKIANEVLPLEKKKTRAYVDGWVIKHLLENIETVEKPMKSKYHIFLGATGQGKTSTIVKFACHLLLKEKKRVAILTGDQIKVGARDQLKTYAQILNIPCGNIKNSSDWLAVEQALKNVDYVLLDTPGTNLRNPDELNILRSILPPNMTGMNIHYVQSIMARDADANEIAERFKVIGFDDVIFTKLDEATKHGMIYNFQKKFSVPLFAFGIGSAMPEDFEFATKERTVDLIFKLSKINKERGQV